MVSSLTRKGFLLCLSLHSIFFQFPLVAVDFHGLYFSDFVTTENGFLIVGLELKKGKSKDSFQAQELRYHKVKGWEEVLYLGFIEQGGPNQVVLSPNSCQVRASASFEEKKGLVRRFDCTHLSFPLVEMETGIFLESSLFGTKQNLKMSVFAKGVSDEPVALSFPLPDSKQGEGIWGFHLNGIKQTNPIQIWDKTANKWAPFRQFEPFIEGKSYHVYRWKRTFSD
ncbi:MAG: hypothetical protein SH817_08920 [Leptospira sp.]|nr:hypothetical protein [Leptospira sp.]